ncbi:MAG: hypothetical protein HGA86_07440, partial [Anaerolineaceae bacterium]|nr:hypothetical protein [Anaerolineaceae bacterium]
MTAFCLFACAPVQPELRSTEAERILPSLALVNGTLIDGTGSEPVPDAVVLIRDGKILAAGPGAEVAVPDGFEIVDLQGGTILPGFINAHVHGAYDLEKLETWASEGVTTVRDLGAWTWPAPFLRDLGLLALSVWS